MFNWHNYYDIHRLVFREGYPGYKPEVKEVPNGDGKIDADKRYAHVAEKYLTEPYASAALRPYLMAAHNEAMRVARAIGIPEQFMPDIGRSAMRVLEYPPGATSSRHTDFDLFTLMLYRDQPRCFVDEHSESDWTVARTKLCELNKQGHMGEIGELIGLGPATLHHVTPSSVAQHSIVYFAIPPWEAVLPSGITVKDWLNERMARSRTAFDKYK